MLTLFSDPREAGTGNDHSHPATHSDYLLAYLRAVDERALPEPFIRALEAALSHFTLRLTSPRDQIESALLRMHRGYSRLHDHTDALLALLSDGWPALPRALSQRLVDVTQEALNDAARRRHFITFDEPLFAAIQADKRRVIVEEIQRGA